MNELIIGDLHCDRKRKVTYGDSSIWDNRVFEILGDILRAEKPEKLVLLGDIFDSYKPDSISVARLLALLLPIPRVIIVEGNHDRPKNSDIDYVFSYLSTMPNISVASANTYVAIGNNEYAVGWHSTQAGFEATLIELAKEKLCDAKVYLHCNTDDFGNLNDNFVSQEFIDLLTADGGMIFTGHDHDFKRRGSLINLGSLIPNTIGELGKKFYWSYNNGIVEIDHKVSGSLQDTDALVYLLREECAMVDVDKAYYIKPTKEVSKEDLTLQSKDLGINIFDDLTKEAVAAGFDPQFIDELFKEL